MSTDRETTRIVRSWLDEGVTQLPDRVLDLVLDQVPATPQRRALWWPARRIAQMSTAARFGLAAAAVVVAALLGYNYLVAPNFGDPGLDDVSPTPSLLARGDFVTNVGEVVELEATREGSSVAGRMTVERQNGANGFTVDLQCARTTEDGLIMIGGITTDTTSVLSPVGSWAGIVLQRGSPVGASTWWQGQASPTASCQAFLEQQLMRENTTHQGQDWTPDPIVGTVELGL